MADKKKPYTETQDWTIPLFFLNTLKLSQVTKYISVVIFMMYHGNISVHTQSHISMF